MISIDTGTVVHICLSLLSIAVAGFAAFGRRVEGGVKETLTRIELTLTTVVATLDALKAADHSTDKEVARHGDRLLNLEDGRRSQDAKIAVLEDALNKHRSVVGDFLSRKLDDYKKDILRDVEDMVRRRRRG